MTREERRELLPVASEFLEAFWKEFGGVESVTMRENGHTFTFPAPVKGRLEDGNG